MIIIGEKLNGTHKLVGQAISERNKAFIQDLALRQVESGSSWLDANAGGSPDQEPQALAWMVDTLQEATETPLCLDSANPLAITAATAHIKRTPMINSISLEKNRFHSILPLLQQYHCPVIVLAMDDKGIPKSAEERVQIINLIIEETRKIKLEDNLLYIDPMIMALSVDTEAGQTALTTIRIIRQQFPLVHIISGLSNISYGLPARSLINRNFMVLAMEAGLDSAILDPLDKKLISTIYTAELILGKDRFCQNYNKAFRAGKLEI